MSRFDLRFHPSQGRCAWIILRRHWPTDSQTGAIRGGERGLLCIVLSRHHHGVRGRLRLGVRRGGRSGTWRLVNLLRRSHFAVERVERGHDVAHEEGDDDDEEDRSYGEPKGCSILAFQGVCSIILF